MCVVKKITTYITLKITIKVKIKSRIDRKKLVTTVTSYHSTMVTKLILIREPPKARVNYYHRTKLAHLPLNVRS